MNVFLTVIVSIFALYAIMQLWVYIKSRKAIGGNFPYENIPDEVVEKIKNKKSLLYFYSPHCYNCRTQTPIIDKLSEEREGIVSIDISQNLQLARQLNLVATPSIMLLNGNKIIEYYVGNKKESFLIEKLQSI